MRVTMSTGMGGELLHLLPQTADGRMQSTLPYCGDPERAVRVVRVDPAKVVLRAVLCSFCRASIKAMQSTLAVDEGGAK